MVDQAAQKFAATTLLLVISVPYELAGSAEKALASTPHVARQETAKAAHVPSDGDLVQKLRDAKIVDPSYSLTATKGSDEVVVKTQRNTKLDDNELKVQAALIAKTVLDGLPSSFVRATVVFTDNGMEETVPVKRQVLGLYGSGKVNEKDLLGLLETTKSKASGKAELTDEELVAVVDGPLKGRRAVQLRRIKSLAARGTNVTQLSKLFDAQEKLAGGTAKGADNLKELIVSIDRITAALREQEDMYKQAHEPIVHNAGMPQQQQQPQQQQNKKAPGNWGAQRPGLRGQGAGFGQGIFRAYQRNHPNGQ